MRDRIGEADKTFYAVLFGGAMLVAAIVGGFGLVVSVVGPSPQAHVYTTDAGNSTLVDDVEPSHECSALDDSYAAEIEPADGVYDRGVRRFVAVHDGNVTDATRVDVADDAGEVCLPEGESTLVAVRHDGGVVGRVNVTQTKDEVMGGG